MIDLTVVQNTPYLKQSKSNLENNEHFFTDPLALGPVRLREKIEGLCDLRGWSVRKLAIEAKVTPSVLLHAFNGHEMGVFKAFRLAEKMGVPVKWLFDDDQGWEQLETRPYWMAPDVVPDRVLSARREFERTLAKGPSRESRNAGGRYKSSPRQPANTAPPATETGKRRKSGA